MGRNTGKKDKGALSLEKNIHVPFCKPWIGEEEIKEVTETLKSGWLTTGPKAKLFEEKLARYNQVKHAVTVDSCTAALHISLLAAGIKPGDEVITTPFTFCSAVNVITYTGAKPVFADIKPETGNIDPEKIREKITENTKGILPMHYAGQPCDMDAVNKIAKSHGLAVVEDAAHALGAEYKGKKAGTLGGFGCYSFYPIKNITTGEGGAVVTDKDQAAEELFRLRYCGIDKDGWKRYEGTGSWYYEVTQLGFKYNLSDVQASIGIAQMEKLDKSIEIRKSIAEKYTRAFSEIEGISPPFVKKDVKHSWHLYVVQLEPEKLKISRNQFIEELKKASIGCSVNFIPIHYHPYYQKEFGLRKGMFPKTEKTFEKIISLPLFPDLTEQQTDQVIETVSKIIEKNRR
jgi:dTDP-4-amino-4,6-dideoxygalactose transaminase